MTSRTTKLQRQECGYITLLTVLIVSAVGAAVSVSLLLISIGSSKSELTYDESSRARALANACAENALERLRKQSSYTGNETLGFSQGSCEILPIGGSGNTNRTVEVVGTVGDIQRKVKVEILQIDPKMEISTWREVMDF